MWFAPKVASTFSTLLEDIFQRSDHFENIPYSEYEVFLASKARQLGYQSESLRRLCFEAHIGINEPTDREDRARKNNVCMQCAAAYRRTKNIVIGLNDAYRMNRRDFRTVFRELVSAGLLPSHAQLSAGGGDLLIHWKTDFPLYSVLFEMVGRTGPDTVMQLVMSVHDTADDLLARVPVGGFFLDFDSFISSLEALRRRCDSDARYSAAILSFLAEEWSDS